MTALIISAIDWLTVKLTGVSMILIWVGDKFRLIPGWMAISLAILVPVSTVTLNVIRIVKELKSKKQQ